MELLNEISNRPTLTPAEASQILSDLGVHCSPEKIRAGLEQSRYPFGEAIRMSKSWAYTIYSQLFIKWLNERIALNSSINA